ncbi:HAMP domain-containing histidine kinase [Paenibacillus sp. SC116]|uniref:HAMP domain-containing sensor histidine kinase n=1 Tax=Paenibacillus sp. SC116 TaxID=2968986 RepID=UPI00215A3720|nr:HAMP domain-containing sensor histidine kinase [Paenibacillus sp. SC116]MCR8843608.1 HAMP domain-containing histidine kinase [Paenibacillus sp. SC116]
MAKMIDWLRLKLNQLTLLQSFILLCSLTIMIVSAIIVMEFEWAENWRRQFANYPSGDDWVLYALIAIVLVTVATGIVTMAIFFYKWKMKHPLELLMKASQKISANDLDFRISYDHRDEMGELCHVFEKMRGQLEENHKVLWRSVEERKQLNAIFAHDLRTPLSVLKGYSEFLTAYLPQNKISKEKLLDTIQTMNVHIVRLESYTEAMNSIQKLEDMPVHSKEIEVDQLASLLDNSARQIAERSVKTFSSFLNVDSSKIAVDIHVVMQVFENMIANGVRYAAGHVSVHYEFSKAYFSITVMDDGAGFTGEGLQKAQLPFYRGEMWEANAHHGLGLYICQVLCEKHKGSLYIDNNPHSGGKVTARFFAELINS